MLFVNIGEYGRMMVIGRLMIEEKIRIWWYDMSLRIFYMGK